MRATENPGRIAGRIKADHPRTLKKMNVIELLQQKSIVPKKASSAKGGEYHSPCPGCAGDDRFHVWPAQNKGKGSYWCRGCKKYGDNIQFMMDFCNMNFKQAIDYLGISKNSPGRTMSTRDRMTPKQQPRAAWTPERKKFPHDVTNCITWQEHAEKFVTKCNEVLLQNDKAILWLKKRGITTGSIIKFRLGLNDKDTYRPRESWGMKGGTNPKTGRPKMFILPRGIVIPWCAGGSFECGKIHRIRIRLSEIDPEYPKKKYHAVVGSCMDTFATGMDKEIATIIETELDAIMIDERAGDITAAVAVGSASAKPTREAADSLFQKIRVLVSLDADPAGDEAAKWWLKTFSNSRRHLPARGDNIKTKDPGELFEQGGDIHAWIEDGLPAIQKVNSLSDVLALPEKKPEQRQRVSKETVVKKPAQVHPEDAVLLIPGVRKLYNLLLMHPVWILNTPDEFGVKEGKKFNRDMHLAGKEDILDLVFSEPVTAYLEKHPADKIWAGNLLKR